MQIVYPAICFLILCAWFSGPTASRADSSLTQDHRVIDKSSDTKDQVTDTSQLFHDSVSNPGVSPTGTSDEQTGRFEAIDSVFFHAQERELRRQYRRCTGDTTRRSLNHVLNWRNTLKQKMQTGQYQRIRRQFIAQLSDVKSFTPCEVFAWHRARVDSIRKKEHTLQQRIASRALDKLDSAALATHLASKVASPFDFKTLPFGTSREMVNLHCKKEWALKLNQRSSYAFGSDIHIDGMPFSIVFFFQDDRLVRYEIESARTYSADSLDTVVRPQAKHLATYYENRIGPADRLYRIGFFDIQPGLLTPYARWEDNGYVAVVGISRDKQRYFAKAQVYMDKEPVWR
ncbi:MAG: hypothetical protein ACOC41_04570 [Chitinivibrionales bacterium]